MVQILELSVLSFHKYIFLSLFLLPAVQGAEKLETDLALSVKKALTTDGKIRYETCF